MVDQEPVWRIYMYIVHTSRPPREVHRYLFLLCGLPGFSRTLSRRERRTIDCTLRNKTSNTNKKMSNV